MNRILRAAIFCAALMVAVSARAETPLAVVEVARVSVAAIAPQLHAPGTVLSTSDAAISAQIAGNLLLVVDVGNRIRKGEPIALIDDRELRLQRDNDRAVLRRLQASHEYLERQQERLSSLASRNNTSEAALDELRAEREMVAEEVAAARVQLERDEYDIARTRVLAPFDGIVAERLQMPGEYTGVGEALVRLVNTESLEISARAPIAVTRFNRAGDEVSVRGDFGTATLAIRALVPVGDPQSRLVEVRLEALGLPLAIGEAVEVALANGAGHESVAVPRDALVLRQDSVHVMRIDAEDIAHKIEVITGDGADGLVAVRGELQPEDRVVVLGGERLRDGQAVHVRNPALARR